MNVDENDSMLKIYSLFSQGFPPNSTSYTFYKILTTWAFLFLAFFGQPVYLIHMNLELNISFFYSSGSNTAKLELKK